MKTKIPLFLSYLENERRYSAQTIKAYQRDLLDLLEFLSTSGTSDLSSLGYYDLRMFIAHLTERDLARTTIRRKLSSIRSFLNYGVKRQWIDANPSELIDYSASSQALPEFFYEDEMKQLLAATAQLDHANRWRDTALLEVLYATGMRVSELCDLKLEQMNLQIQILRVIGKGNKERLVPLGDAATEALTNYLTHNRPALDVHQNEWVFLSTQGTPLTPDQVRKILRQILKASGLNTAIYPHKLRHTFATHMLNHGADLRTVQEILGHMDLSSTQIYTHVSKDQLRNHYLKAHPRANRDKFKD